MFYFLLHKKSHQIPKEYVVEETEVSISTLVEWLRFFSTKDRASLAVILTPIVHKHRATRNQIHVCILPVIHYSLGRRYEWTCLCLYFYFFLWLKNNTYKFIWNFWRCNFSKCESRNLKLFLMKLEFVWEYKYNSNST